MKISTIIPIYNSDKYLDNTIQSVLNQEYKNFELILINDASKDNSLEICKKYSKMDKRIKIINFEENKGVSAARNYGIKISTGEYIHFMDSDDTLEKNMYSDIVAQCENNAFPDLIITGTNYFFEKEKKDEFQPEYKLINDGNIKEYLNKYVISGRRSIFNFVWNKLFKKEIIKSFKIKFDEEMSLGEDFIFVCDFMLKMKTALSINKSYYNYYKRESDGTALTMKFRPDILKTRRRSYSKWTELFSFYECYEENKEKMELYEGMKTYQALRSVNSKNCKLCFEDKKEYINNLFNYENSDYLIRYMKKNIKHRLELFLIQKKQYKILLKIWKMIGK